MSILMSSSNDIIADIQTCTLLCMPECPSMRLLQVLRLSAASNGGIIEHPFVRSY